VKNPRKKIGTLERQRERWFYLLVSPWLLGFILFQLVPLTGVFLLSFHNWPLPNAPYFVGVEHLTHLFGDQIFKQTLMNTITYALGTVPTRIALGLILALLLNRELHAIAVWRSIFFLPVVISGVATTLLWGWIFNPKYGLVNHLLSYLGISGPGWFYDEAWAMPALILMSLWNVGVNMVVYLAALQNIPLELKEAAKLDGARGWKRFVHITWPLLSPATFYLLIVNLIGAFQVFTPTYILTRGGPNNATLTLPLYIYLNVFSYARLGYGAALSWFVLMLILGFTIVQFRFSRSWVFYTRGEFR
jgi:multiple sugar transport system permease protein